MLILTLPSLPTAVHRHFQRSCFCPPHQPDHTLLKVSADLGSFFPIFCFSALTDHRHHWHLDAVKNLRCVKSCPIPTQPSCTHRFTTTGDRRTMEGFGLEGALKLTQPGFRHFQGWGIHNSSMPGPPHPLSQECKVKIPDKF